MTESSPGQGFLLEEWKEARSSIRRFDEYLLNLRRYGFTLATILIGADAYLSMQAVVHPLAKAGAAVAVMLLIFALFLLDHHVKLLQEIALRRAVELEKHLEPGSEFESLSKLRQNVTNSWQVAHGGTPVYVLFLFVTGGLGSTAVVMTSTAVLTTPAEKWVPLGVVVFICLILCVVTPVYNWLTMRRVVDFITPGGVGRQLAGAFTRLGQTLRKKDKQT